MRTARAALLALTCTVPAIAQEPLRIVASGPEGALAGRDQAAEVRVVFSEPMVALGRAAGPARAPFLRIEPPLPGTLRWSGTDTLIFTPHEGALPWATRFEVSVAAGARAVSGAALPAAHRFVFSTPPVAIDTASWAREGERFDAPLLVGVRFNQPIDAETLLPHLELRYEPHDWPPPEAAPPGGAAWEAEAAAARAAAAARGPVRFERPREWDRRRFPPSEDLLVLRTLETPPPGTWLRLALGPEAPSPAGPLTPGESRGVVLQLEDRFVVEGFRCSESCDPDDWNPLRLRREVRLSHLAERIRVFELLPDGSERPLEPRRDADAADYATGWVGFGELGYRLAPARRYRVSLPADVVAEDGQRLGYDWSGELQLAHRRALSHFGGAHGVWEASGGTLLPFYARNLEAVSYWLKPVTPDELVAVAVALQEESSFRQPPPVAPRRLALEPSPDEVQSFGLELGPVLGPGGHGLVWAALLPDAPIAGVPPETDEPDARATLVQVTDLGLTLKDSPQGSLALVTRLDDGAPVAGARLTLRNVENAVLWQGESDADGVARLPALPLRDADGYWQLRFFLIAEKEGDLAYLASDWNSGVEPWYFDLRYDLREAMPQLRGQVFADRGVYRLGEEVRFKVVLRSDTARGMELLPAGTRVELVLSDARGAEVAKQTLELSAWSSGEWRVALPEEAPLGNWRVTASAAGHPDPVAGDLLVAAYRRPDFRVDAALESEGRVAGTALHGRVEGRYLFGAPMQGRAARWSVTRTPLHDVPGAVSDAFGGERWVFLEQRWDAGGRPPEGALLEESGALDEAGVRELSLETERDAGVPYRYRLEGEVTDVSRQAIAGRADVRVEAAPFYVGLRRPPWFADAGATLETAVVAAGLDGRPVEGVSVALELVRVQWHSVRRAEGGGYYTWETERREVPAGSFEATTGPEPVPLEVPLGEGGYYELRARAGDGEGRSTTTATSFYALGRGYTAWARHDHARIDLVPERSRYRPGETARVLIQSPWESATALLTAEREGVRWHERFELTSTQQTVEVPISADDIPNLYVSVLLVKGRSAPFSNEDTSDPGRPAFRLGYVELEVEDDSRRLDVTVESDREEYRPGDTARVAVRVADREGRPEPAEVTLWAVDYGVLSLTGYRTPDLLGSVWVPKALQVMNEDSRQNIISRRVMSSKGGEEGGGGGDAAAAGEVRKDFRALAFWLGSLETDAAGRASAEVELPDGLTTWRVMAVAADRSSRFGRGDLEIRTSKPLLLAPAFPRFLGLGDRASFGAVVHSRLERGGPVEVRFESLDPDRLEVRGDSVRRLDLAPGASTEVRFEVAARAPGDARVRMRVSSGDETDAFEEIVPVRVLAPVSATAAYGTADPEARESLDVSGALPAVGGLEVEVSSTALVGLGEGARYLVDYPWGCAEQRASATLALAVAADLGGAFAIPELDPADLDAAVGEATRELGDFQCDDGSFAYWQGRCRAPSPYLAAWVLHVLGRALELGHPVPAEVLERGYSWLELQLGQGPGTRTAASAATRALAVKVLAEAGRNVDSPLTRLMAELDRQPVFGLAYLLDAVTAAGGTPEWETELERRLRNAILPEGGSAHVEELDDPELLWLWSSSTRSTAIALGSLVRRGADTGLTAGMVRWLLDARREGRWGNTQENAAALEALVAYYRREEAEPPDFEAVARLAGRELLRAEFRERGAPAVGARLPMAEVLAAGEGSRALVVEREGSGRLYYAVRVTRAEAGLRDAPVDAGLRLERRYAPHGAGAGAPGATSFQAGDLVRVTLRLSLTKERRFVALRDPLPAGLEPVESWFATTAADLTRTEEDEDDPGRSWLERWRRGGFDHVERHDDRVELFATRLGAGEHEFSYLARATTAGRFTAASASAEEMYAPEVYGLTPSAGIEVRP